MNDSTTTFKMLIGDTAIIIQLRTSRQPLLSAYLELYLAI